MTSPSMFEDVSYFHWEVLSVVPPSSPTLISQDFVLERGRFLQEELDEYLTDGLSGNIVGVADALADIIYVALGTAYQMGLPFDEIWKAVQRANVRKRPGITKRGNAIDAIKPEGWVGPETEIARLINEAIK
jgi:hypothetical protein